MNQELEAVINSARNELDEVEAYFAQYDPETRKTMPPQPALDMVGQMAKIMRNLCDAVEKNNK